MLVDNCFEIIEITSVFAFESNIFLFDINSNIL